MISKGNHVKFARFVACSQWRSKNMTSKFASLTERDIEKNSWRQGITKHKNVGEGGKGAVCWLRESEKTEKTWGIFTRLEINYQFLLLSWPFFFRSMYNKTIIRFGFCDIQNNQGLGKGYRLRLITPTSTLVIVDITETSSNNCL